MSGKVKWQAALHDHGQYTSELMSETVRNTVTTDN